MTKREETTTANSTWNRTSDDEPVFILCGRDRLAPNTIRDWARRALANNVDPGKVNEAFRFADRVDQWQSENPDRVKRPD